MAWFGQAFGGDRLRRLLASIAACVLCLLGAAFYLTHLNHSYRVSEWLGLHLLELILWTVLLHGSLVVVGARLLRMLVPADELGTGEYFLQSFVLGIGLFALSMYLAGSLALFRPWFAVALPAVFLLSGASEIPRLVSRLREALRPTWSASLAVNLLRAASYAFGTFMIALLYLECLTPDSFNFDAIWYHIPVAQDYARMGSLVPFYGDNHRAYPHLTSLFHTWALLVPTLEPVQLKWMLMLHLEFAIVLWRIVGVAAMMRWLLDGRKVAGLWPVFFLFPSVFVYDQNIGGSADHVIGVTAIPIFLALMRTLPRFRWGFAVLTGIAAGVHILAKYQAIYSVVGVAVFASLRATYLLLARVIRVRRGRALSKDAPAVRAILLGPSLILLSALFVSAPHFIKNAVFYQNPIYPFAQQRFPSTFDDWEGGTQPKDLALDPSASRKPKKREKSRSKASEDDAPISAAKKRVKDPWDFQFDPRGVDFKPQGDGPVEKLVWLHKTLADWPFLTGNRGLTEGRPYMGALFILLLPTLVLLRGARRLWLGVGYVYVVFSVWALTSANDRYLLAVLGLPIAMAGALLVRVASLGLFARLGLGALVLVQFLWGVDAPFHYGGARLQDAISLIRAGYSGTALESRLRHRKTELSVSSSLPDDAVVLGRYYKSLLGFDRTTLNTHADIQTYIDFKQLHSLDDFWNICRDRGVTHLLYPDGERQPVRAQELVLFDALADRSREKVRSHGLVIAELDSAPPGKPDPFLVLVYGMREYRDGLHLVSELSLDGRREHKGGPKPLEVYRASALPSLLERADAVLLGGGRSELGRDELSEAFKKVEDFRSLEVWLRKE